MGRATILATLTLLVLAGCAEEGALDEGDEDAGSEAPDAPTTPAATTSPTAPSTPTASTPAATTAPTTSTPTPTATTTSTTPTPTSATPTPLARVTDGPAGDTDKDGIPDTHESALASSCSIAGRTCAELSLEPPTVGYRDLVIAQVGRSGTEQNWRANANVWDSVKMELQNHSIKLQVADLGTRDDINVEATWDDTANEGKYWHAWLLYDDPATVITTETSGSQTYNLIKIADRENDLETRATILHEIYHALLGELNAGRSACANEETGGPTHSNDENSVLYTSPDCETNEGSYYKLSAAETTELRQEPISVFREMNAPDWFTSVA